MPAEFRPTRPASEQFRAHVRSGRRSYEAMSTKELGEHFETIYDELSWRLEMTIPGGDFDQHYRDHVEMANKRIFDERMKIETKIRFRSGITHAIVFLAILTMAAILYSFWKGM